MKLSKSTVEMMIALRSHVKTNRPHAESILHRCLDDARARVERLNAERGFSRGSRISLGLRRARARNEVAKWFALCDELRVPALCERALP